MIQPPCKDCERRTVKPNCHATCKKYVEYVTSREKFRQEKRKNALIAEYIVSKKRK